MSLISELRKFIQANIAATMDCVICSSPILESTWIDLTECCNASIHDSCLGELGATCPSCGKDLDVVLLNILEPNDVEAILDTNANEEETFDVTVPIFDVSDEAEPVHLHLLAGLDFEDNNSNDPIIDENEVIRVDDDLDEQEMAQELFRRNVLFIPMESDESSGIDSIFENPLTSEDENDNPNADPDWDISQVQANSDDSNQQ